MARNGKFSQSKYTRSTDRGRGQEDYVRKDDSGRIEARNTVERLTVASFGSADTDAKVASAEVVGRAFGEGVVKAVKAEGGFLSRVARRLFGGDSSIVTYEITPSKEGYSAVFSDKATYDRSVDLIVASIQNGTIKARTPDE